MENCQFFRNRRLSQKNSKGCPIKSSNVEKLIFYPSQDSVNLFPPSSFNKKIRPKTTNSKVQKSERKLKTLSTQNSSEKNLLSSRMLKNYTSRKVEQVYYSKRLNLTENSFIFDEDVFKLQNIITGGYCCEDQFMSLSKFNQTKDNFVLLKQIYDKAREKQKLQQHKTEKQKIKKRNIFSVLYLNQNLKSLSRKQSNALFQDLKIVR